MEYLLIIVVYKFVFKYTLTFVSPECDQEQLLSDLLLKLSGVLNDVVFVLLSHSADTLEHSGQLSDVEDVMELGWGREKSSLNLLPKNDSALNKERFHGDNFRVVSLGVEEQLQDLSVDVLN